ncbi:MAG: hypothetical protein Q4P33_01660 [Flaviflexus sp.]|nr:hypothetical protein [Flaviflexus sp.]
MVRFQTFSWATAQLDHRVSGYLLGRPHISYGKHAGNTPVLA